VSDRRGFIEQAHRGTLFIDEVADLSLAAQAKLLRVLQEKTLKRLGSEKWVEADFRVICATHKDMRQLISEGKFREDLYYRLVGFHLHMPPLRDRSDDVLFLAEVFKNRFL